MIAASLSKLPAVQKAWKKVFARRTSVERTLKRILVDYLTERARAHSDKRWFFITTLAALNQHLDALTKVTEISLIQRLGLLKHDA